MVFGMVLVVLLAMLSMSFAMRIETNEMRQESDIASSQALQIAQSAVSVKILGLWREFRTRRTDQRVAWLGGEDQNQNRLLDSGEDANFDTTRTGPLGLPYDTDNPSWYPAGGYLNSANPPYPIYIPSTVSYGSDADFVKWGVGDVKVRIEVIRLNKKESVDLRFTATARVEGMDFEKTGRGLDGIIGTSDDTWQRRKVVRKIERIVTYGLEPAEVFDFVYFANNYGWMYGAGLNLWGNMGANGNLGFSGSPKVNGRLFAAKNPAIGAAGIVTGRSSLKYLDTASQYLTYAANNPMLRPLEKYAWQGEDLNNNGILDAGEDQPRPPNGVLDDGEDTNANGILDAGEDKEIPANGILDQARTYDIGYDPTRAPGDAVQPLGAHQMKEKAPKIDMPYLGDLSMYRDLATSYARPVRTEFGETAPTFGGIVKQLKAPGLDPTNPDNYNVIVDGTYGYSNAHNGKYTNHTGFENGGKGPDNIAGTADDEKVELVDIPEKLELDPAKQMRNGNLALIGTEAQPIIVMGPVVVSNDLVIKGVMRGQGTFYVGRNTHVVGNLTYGAKKDFAGNTSASHTATSDDDIQNGTAPTWKTDDPNFSETVTKNKAKDGVGFGTRGNVILGNYNSSEFNTNYMKPPFTQPYIVDSSDQEIGYSTTVSGDVHTFHGNYTSPDTGKSYQDVDATTPDWTTPTTVARKYYESSFPASYINSIAGKPEFIHGIFYTNHMFGGRTNRLKMYGNLVTRDEGIVTDSSADFYYDTRIAKAELSSYIELFLPRNSVMRSGVTREGIIDQRDLGNANER
jgi:hypothetical protein